MSSRPQITRNVDDVSIRSTGPEIMYVSGACLSIKSIGNSTFTSQNSVFHLKDVFHVPTVTKKLLSISKFTNDNDVSVEFFPSFCTVKDLFSGQVLLKGVHDHDQGLYKLGLSLSYILLLIQVFLSSIYLKL